MAIFWNGPLAVSFTFVRAATYDRDYTGLPRVLLFVSEQSLHSLSCVNVTIINDAVLEETENFTVVLLTEFSGVTISRAKSLVEIIDNDSKKQS